MNYCWLLDHILPFCIGALSGMGIFAITGSGNMPSSTSKAADEPVKPEMGKVVFYDPDGRYIRSARASVFEIGRLSEILDRRDGM